MQKIKILIIEDEKDLAEAISVNLRQNGFEIYHASDGIKGLNQARSILPDVIVLDLMLPFIGGYDICKLIKSDTQTSEIPILIISAKDKDSDIVKGLNCGGDDYLTKPFNIQILIARVNNLIRRNSKRAVKDAKLKQLGDLKIDPSKKCVFLKGRNIKLTATEYKIIDLFVSNPDKVLTRHEIIRSVHGENYSATDRSVDYQVTCLRKKLKNYSGIISTVRGFGYQLLKEYAA